ncbi:peptide chain release factor N(5)-glutamine methyltransferase [Clostridium thermarum]|uniref:peptide chain release factor N(5)-glutamine methyltransferase n=1 Tax=Clostridium thermarum TaxID=1716543 RepID=UPI001FA973CF|nr:peptide chain release factor N(5)-glutamine methyltransferase [Clostridium thermarum]
MSKKTSVGGQAVIEGVMMRGQKGIATAVRLADGSIEVDIKKVTPYTKRNKILSLPVIRGAVSLIESLIVGIKTLNYSASFFEEEGEESKFDAWFNKVFGEKSNDILIGISLVISLSFSVLLFFVLPTFLSNLLYKLYMNRLTVNIIEGLLRVAIFLGYIFLVGKIDDINRVFQYHGAEHKTIFCYENERELTPENAATFERFHPRCGTNFLFLVMIVSIALFSVVEFDSMWQKISYRVLLLPLVSGISYELIRWMGNSEGSFSKVMAYPGLKLQELTTREPDLSQLEVAIVALKAAENLDYSREVKLSRGGSTIGDLLNRGNEILKNENIDSYVLDAQLLLAKVLQKDKLYIITHRNEVVDKDKADKFLGYIQLRKERMPVKYILEECEFMGINLYIKPGVLIPRPDTEVLVETVLEEIKNREYTTVCDICSGSGAIGIAIASMVNNVKVECVDISDIAKEVNTKNIVNNSLQDRVRFTSSDLLDKAISEGNQYDVIVSNPPYIREAVIEELMEDVKKYEPHLALSGGEDGLVFYRKITEQALKCLKDGGLLAYEIGYDQREEVEAIMKEQGFEDVKCIKDLAGNDRVVIGFFKCKDILNDAEVL